MVLNVAHNLHTYENSVTPGPQNLSLVLICYVGCYTNEQVQGYILLPLIELLMSTPASLAISKVSELELLTVLARHDNHKEGLYHWSLLHSALIIFLLPLWGD